MLKKLIAISSDYRPARFVGEIPWIALVLCGTLLPLLTVLATGHTLDWRDTSQLFAPMRGLIADALREGRLPLWNPYEGTGMPLFAQLLHGVLHPWSVIAAFVAPGNDIDLLIVLHVATGAVGAGVLARTLGASRRAAAVAGLSYGLSGYLLGTIAVIQYLAAGSSAPWAVAGLCVAARGGAVRLALGAAGMAVLYFAGDPQWAMLAALLGALLAWEQGGQRGLAWAVAATAAGTALACIQLLPTWFLLQASSRGAGLSPEDSLQWALAPARIIEFVIPGFFGGRPGPVPAPVFLWLGGESSYPLPFLSSIFLGLPVLALATAAIGATRLSRLLGWSALFFLWLALGHFAGADSALGWVPIWSSFRYAEKVVGPFTLCVSLLAALGLERFVATMLPRSVRLAFIGCLAAMLLAGLSFGLVEFASPGQMIPEEAWVPLGRRLSAGLLLAAFGLAAIGCAGLSRNRGGGSGSSGAAMWILAAVLATGLAGSAAALHFGRSDSRDRAPLTELRANGQVTRVVTPVDDIALPINRGFDYFDALQAVRSRTGAAPFNVPSQVDNFTTYTGLPPARYTDLVSALNVLGESRWIAYRRFAVTHTVLTPPLSQRDEAAAKAAISGGRLFRRDPDWNISVWDIPHAPWARFAEKVLPASSEAEAVAAVVRLESTGDRAVVLQGAPPAVLTSGIVRSIERSPQSVQIVAESPGEGLLVVADAFWDGWEATIDGQTTGIELADGLVRAVRWPAGRHVLMMRYRPVEVRIGAAVSGVTTALLFGFVAWERRRRRKV